MIKCDYFKKSINKCKCKLSNSTITLLDCIKCTKFKQTSVSSINITPRNKSVLKRIKTPLNKVSKKRIKLEKERFSIFTNDLTKCIENEKHEGHIDKHECIYGTNRYNSIKYGLVVPLCRVCHEDKNIKEKWLFTAQKEFIKRYSYDKFMEVFKINFIEKRTNKKRPTRFE